MSNEIVESVSDAAALAVSVATHVPAPVSKGFFKAIGLLVGSLTEIPVAHIEGKVELVRQTSANRIALERALGERAVELALDDPARATRALGRIIHAADRKQENLEAIARKTADQLNGASELPTEEPEAPSDDWLNLVSKYAEDASSERLRDLWASVLAGEIRKPGAFSLRTLRSVSELDQRTIADFEALAPYVFGGGIPTSVIGDSGPLLDATLRLEAEGFLTGGVSRGLTRRVTISPTPTSHSHGAAGFSGREYTVGFNGPLGERVEYSNIQLSVAGAELMQLTKQHSELDAALRLASELAPHLLPVWLQRNNAGIERYVRGGPLDHPRDAIIVSTTVGPAA